MYHLPPRDWSVHKAILLPIGREQKPFNPSMYLPDYSLCPLIPLSTAVKHRSPGELCSSCQYGVIHKIQIHTRNPYHHVWRQEVSFLNPFLKNLPFLVFEQTQLFQTEFTSIILQAKIIFLALIFNEKLCDSISTERITGIFYFFLFKLV
jgi:hypothetical protein